MNIFQTYLIVVTTTLMIAAIRPRKARGQGEEHSQLKTVRKMKEKGMQITFMCTVSRDPNKVNN